MKRGINIPKAVVAGSLVSPFRASEEPVFGTYVLTMPQVCPHQNRILRKDLMMKHPRDLALSNRYVVELHVESSFNFIVI